MQVGSDVSLKSLARSVDPGTPNLWYAQDAGGAIWKVDIVVSHTVSNWRVISIYTPTLSVLVSSKKMVCTPSSIAQGS